MGHTKKTVVFAILYIGYAVGNLIGPQTFLAYQTPAYMGGTTLMIVCNYVCMVIMGAYWDLAAWQNKNRAASVSSPQDGNVVESLLDRTDLEQEGFMCTT